MRSQLTNATITNINGSPWVAEYNYRKNGDMATRTITGLAETSFAYTGNLMDSASGGENFDLGWDKNGNLEQKNMATATDTNLVSNWDNKLRHGQYGSSSIDLKYDPDGNRIWKKSGSTTQRKYIVDIVGDLPTILLELDPQDNMLIKKTYIYANGEILAQHNGDVNVPRYFYLHDRLGSVREVIDANGTVKAYLTYNPFGVTIESGPTTPAVIQMAPFRFAGQYYDTQISQYYLRARMYDPLLGRFTSRDPIDGGYEEPLTLHKYLYCINDPVNKTDPSGQEYDYFSELVTMDISGYLAAELTAKFGLGASLALVIWQQAIHYQSCISIASAGGEFLDAILAHFASKDYKFKGGKITTRDQWGGLEKMPEFDKFKQWFHKYWKQKTKIKNPTPEDMWEAYDEFVNNWQNWDG